MSTEGHKIVSQTNFTSAQKSILVKRTIGTWYHKSYGYHYLIIFLMFLSATLGSTIFNTAQVFCELVLFILLGFGILKSRLSRIDVLLLGVFFITSTISLFYIPLLHVALNFKIYGLCIMTFIYFRKSNFYPGKFINFIHFVNIFLVVHQFIFGHFIVQSAWFFEEYKSHVNERPVGIFLTPHATSFFIATYIIYIIKSNKQYFKGLLYFVLTLMTSSFTSTVALLAQLSQQFLSYIMNRFSFLKINIGPTGQLLIVVVPIILLSIYTSEFIEFLKFSSYTRYYSLEITLGQIFDSRYFTDIFRIYFRNYQEYIFSQERTFADVGNEIGIIKIFVEGGVILGSLILFTLIRYLRHYSIFIFVSLLHYSFVINMPLMLFLMLYYNREIENRDLIDAVKA